VSSISPYDEALSIIKQHPGTGGAGGLAKLVLSLYNSDCGFSFAECVGSLDDRLTSVALRMVQDYAAHGESDDLRAAGKIISTDLYPELWEMSMAMRDAREATRRRWQQEEQDREAAEIEADESSFLSDAGRRSVPVTAADEMIQGDEGDEEKVSAYYFRAGNWHNKKLPLDQVRAAVRSRGTGFIYCRAESSTWLGVPLDDRLYYVYPDYDARERYLEANPQNRSA
jgi:hypothetical protein